MVFFDFLYYSIYQFYSDYNEKGAASTSAGIIGGLQTLNVLTGIMLFQLLFQPQRQINKLWAVLLFIVFQVYTYYRYIYRDNHSVQVMEKKWLSKTAQSRKQTNVFLFIYGLLSIVGCFGLAIYLGSLK